LEQRYILVISKYGLLMTNPSHIPPRFSVSQNTLID